MVALVYQNNTVLLQKIIVSNLAQIYFMARRKSLVSKVTKKYQATIPQDVRKVLEMRTNGIQKLPSLTL
ncbi:hypothetical protein CSQ79_14630 [Gloeocapsopsis sp. IPPAS B-1203]|nr:hypothetical protein CSQ79_14630 [Gloeocapsopsis sp. IPPAS B-1203]